MRLVLRSPPALQAERTAWLQSGSTRERRASRERLPAFGRRGAFLEALAARRVVVISGATGCGKSTQMPQYILEQARAHVLLKATAARACEAVKRALLWGGSSHGPPVAVTNERLTRKTHGKGLHWWVCLK